MLTILLLFIIFSAIYLTVGIVGIALKLTFGIFKAGREDWRTLKDMLLPLKISYRERSIMQSMPPQEFRP